MTDGTIDVFVTGDTPSKMVKFQPGTTNGRILLERHFGTRLDRCGVLWVEDTECDTIFNLIDDAGLWTETRG